MPYVCLSRVENVWENTELGALFYVGTGRFYTEILLFHKCTSPSHSSRSCVHIDKCIYIEPVREHSAAPFRFYPVQHLPRTAFFPLSPPSLHCLSPQYSVEPSVVWFPPTPYARAPVRLEQRCEGCHDGRARRAQSYEPVSVQVGLLWCGCVGPVWRGKDSGE